MNFRINYFSMFLFLFATCFCVLFLKAKKDVEFVFPQKEAHLIALQFSENNFISFIFQCGSHKPYSNYSYGRRVSWSIYPFSTVRIEIPREKVKKLYTQKKEEQKYETIWGSQNKELKRNTGNKQ